MCRPVFMCLEIDCEQACICVFGKSIMCWPVFVCLGN